MSRRRLLGLDFEGEEGRAKGLSLSVSSEGDRSAAAEGTVEQEVEGAEVRQFEALDFAAYEIAEVGFHAFAGDFAKEDRVFALVKPVRKAAQT